MRYIRDEERLDDLLSNVTEDNKHGELITDCVCGNTDPHEPWWEDCDLGNNEKFARVAELSLEEEEILCKAFGPRCLWGGEYSTNYRSDDDGEDNQGLDHYTQEDS